MMKMEVYSITSIVDTKGKIVTSTSVNSFRDPIIGYRMEATAREFIQMLQSLGDGSPLEFTVRFEAPLVEL